MLRVNFTLNYEHKLEHEGYGPDMLETLPNKVLTTPEIGLCHGDAIQLKHGCAEWWKLEAKPSQKENAHGHVMLLDNETVVQGVWAYLAAQALGSITPHLLCHHVNMVIVPALTSIENTTISEWTARNWLRKLGYLCKDAQKGLYFDGHEREDVVEARRCFLERIEQYSRCASV